MESCRKTVSENPDDLYLRQSLINHYLDLQMRPDAIREMELIRARQPDNYLLLAKLAGDYLREGNEVAAEALFVQTLRINPYYEVARHNLTVLRERRKLRESGTPHEQQPGP